MKNVSKSGIVAYYLRAEQDEKGKKKSKNIFLKGKNKKILYNKYLDKDGLSNFSI